MAQCQWLSGRWLGLVRRGINFLFVSCYKDFSVDYLNIWLKFLSSSFWKTERNCALSRLGILGLMEDSCPVLRALRVGQTITKGWSLKGDPGFKARGLHVSAPCNPPGRGESVSSGGSSLSGRPFHIVEKDLKAQNLILTHSWLCFSTTSFTILGPKPPIT
jgi:hypothetical protein